MLLLFCKVDLALRFQLVICIFFDIAEPVQYFSSVDVGGLDVVVINIFSTVLSRLSPLDVDSSRSIFCI